MLRSRVLALGLLGLVFLGCSSTTGSSPSDAGVRDGATVDRGATVLDGRLSDGRGGDALRDGSTGDAAPVKPVTLPEDEAPHKDPVEWWYYTGVLKAESGESYGFELVVFQAFIVGQPAYLAHFAVTDLAKKSFALDTQLSLGPQPPAKAGFDLTVGGWRVAGHDGKDQLAASMKGYAIELNLAAKKPVVLQYGKGWMTVGSTKPFYYYSYTDMAVSGSITVDGVKKNVTGTTWMDHQWGTMGQDYSGWDWFSLRLDDRTDVMLFTVRRPGKPGFNGGTVIDAAGKGLELKDTDFSVKSTGQWVSPHTQGTYPHGWTVTIPSQQLDVTITPLVADQEFHQSIGGTPIYWEGLCRISGTRAGKPIGGDAYVELTGYAKKP